MPCRCGFTAAEVHTRLQVLQGLAWAWQLPTISEEGPQLGQGRLAVCTAMLAGISPSSVSPTLVRAVCNPPPLLPAADVLLNREGTLAKLSDVGMAAVVSQRYVTVAGELAVLTVSAGCSWLYLLAIACVPVPGRRSLSSGQAKRVVGALPKLPTRAANTCCQHMLPACLLTMPLRLLCLLLLQACVAPLHGQRLRCWQGPSTALRRWAW